MFDGFGRIAVGSGEGDFRETKLGKVDLQRGHIFDSDELIACSLEQGLDEQVDEHSGHQRRAL